MNSPPPPDSDSLPQPRRRKTAPSCYPGNRQRTRRPSNCPRPPVSLRLGPSNHPDNRYPFRSTISPFPITLATVARPTAPWTHHPHPARRPPRPRPPPQARGRGVPFPSCPSPRRQGALFPPWKWRPRGGSGAGDPGSRRASGPPGAEAVHGPLTVSRLALLRGTVQPQQGAFQNASHVPPLLKTLPWLPLRIESKLLTAPGALAVASSPPSLCASSH